MVILKQLFDFCFSLLNIPFTIFGFTFSFWSIIVWSLVLGFILWFIFKLFNIGGD